MGLAIDSVTRDYGDVAEEVRACRTRCALFDFSFLERARVEGPQAQRVLEGFARRGLAALREGEIRYALRVDSLGHARSDLTIWKTGPQSFELMSGRREDVLDLGRLSCPQAEVTDLGARTAVLALQGPLALQALAGLGDLRAIEALGYFQFQPSRLAGIECVIGRLGYTGEPGFEIVLRREDRNGLWAEFAKRARPAGFAAADILRIEAGFVLFTNEFALPVTPREAGLGRFCDGLDPGPRLEIRLVAFRASSERNPCLWQPADRPTRPAAPGAITVTSACESPAAGGILGLGYVAAGSDGPWHDPSGQFGAIRAAPLPFYDPGKRRPRAGWTPPS